jgi:hypothetical protein
LLSGIILKININFNVLNNIASLYFKHKHNRYIMFNNAVKYFDVIKVKNVLTSSSYQNINNGNWISNIPKFH